MKLIYTIGAVEWIDIVDPSESDIRDLVETYGIDPIVAEEMLVPIERPKVREYPNYLYTILHFPELSDSVNPRNSRNQYEVDFILSANRIITVHSTSFPLLYDFTKTIELPTFAKSLPPDFHAGHLFVLLMRHFYTHIAVQLDTIGRNLNSVEDKIFQGKEAEMITVLSHINRSLLDLKRAIRFHGSTMDRFLLLSAKLYSNDYQSYCKQIVFEYDELAKALSSHKETLEDLWKTNDTLVTAKTNDTMRKLTALSFVTFPLSVIVGFFGMNMTLPLIGGMKDFLIVILGMLSAALFLVAYLQKRKWL
jgi:magnesium transporter